jgi:hypothetical protein
MCPIVSFSNDKSTTDQKKSPLRFIPSSDFIIENKCNIGHYLILQSMPCIISIGDLRHIWQTLWLSSTHLANPLIVFDTFGKPFDCLRHIWQTLWLSSTHLANPLIVLDTFGKPFDCLELKDIFQNYLVFQSFDIFCAP